MKLKLIFALALTGFLSVHTGYAQQSSDEGEPLFDPKVACGDILPVTQTIDKVMVGLWASGYLAGQSGIVVPMGEASNEILLERLNLACVQSINAPLVTIVEYVGDDLAASKDQFEVGSTDLIPGSPKPEQTKLISFFTTIDELKQSPNARFHFPGGYNEILQYFITDAPIATFKFVRPGNDVGLTINGLIYINDRWVIMPKPWRALHEN